MNRSRYDPENALLERDASAQRQMANALIEKRLNTPEVG
jgi:hypothetical protein